MPALRLGMPTIGGRAWLGGWNYMTNLLDCIAEHGAGRLEVVVFAGADLSSDALAELQGRPGVDVVIDPAFDAARKSERLIRAILTGRDVDAAGAFAANRIDVAFEPVSFFGWRLGLPALAWIPDFQHRRLPQFFTRSGRLRREIGFRAQILSRRRILLSSGDAERDCLAFYPAARRRTHVARFAVGAAGDLDLNEARARADVLGLPERFLFLPNQMWAHKNHRVAVEAAGRLKAAGDSTMIVATGHGDDPRAPDLRASIEGMIGSAGLDHQFRITGALPYRDVRALSMVASAIINPSRFEGWSTTVEEAKAIGTPMILSDLPVHREQAADRASFFAPDDSAALAALIAAQPTRTLAQIARDMANAAARNAADRVAFADAFIAAVEATAAGR